VTAKKITNYVCEAEMKEGSMGWSLSPGKVKNFHLSILSRPALGSTQPPIQWIWRGPLYIRVKQQGREANHSPLTSAEVKKHGSMHPLPYRPS
jgi:hypothetical protein